MAAQTAATRDDVVFGDKRGVLATFTSVADGDTYVTGLSVIRALSAEGGNKTATVAATVSGGTVTFNINNGPATVVQFMAFGY